MEFLPDILAMHIVDVALVGLMLFGAIVGVFAGFFNPFLRLFGKLIALALGLVLGIVVAQGLTEVEIISADGSLKAIADLIETLRELLFDKLGLSKINVADMLAPLNDVADGLGALTNNVVLYAVFICVILAVGFVVFQLVLFIVRCVFEILFSIPVLDHIDRILGGIWGMAIPVIIFAILTVVIMAANKFLPDVWSKVTEVDVGDGKTIGGMIDDSYAIGYISNAVSELLGADVLGPAIGSIPG